MYSKFYEYYYDSNYGHNHHHNHHHHHHYGPHHYGPHHHYHHHHQHLNLLDFLEKKNENNDEDDDDEPKSKNLISKLLDSNLFSALKLNGLHSHHYDYYDDHHYHHNHHLDNDYYPYNHHHHHHHHLHHEDRFSYLDHDHYDYIENYRFLKRNFYILKKKINYYQSQNMQVPWSLLQDYNRLGHTLDRYHDHPHRHYHHHHHHHHLHPINNHLSYIPRIYSPDLHYLKSYDYPYDKELTHYDDDFHLHHLVHNYNNDMVNYFNKQMFLPAPAIPAPIPPSNY